MKRLFFTILAIAATAASLQSCLNDDKNEVTCSYCGMVEDITFTDPGDSIFIEPICVALSSSSMKLIGGNSSFKKSAEAESYMYGTPVVLCNTQAITTYKEMMSATSTSQLKNIIKINTNDSLCVDTLDRFTVKLGLYGYYPNATEFTLLESFEKSF